MRVVVWSGWNPELISTQSLWVFEIPLIMCYCYVMHTTFYFNYIYNIVMWCCTIKYNKVWNECRILRTRTTYERVSCVQYFGFKNSKFPFLRYTKVDVIDNRKQVLSNFVLQFWTMEVPEFSVDNFSLLRFHIFTCCGSKSVERVQEMGRPEKPK